LIGEGRGGLRFGEGRSDDGPQAQLKKRPRSPINSPGPQMAGQEGRHAVVRIPKTLHEHINTAYPTHVCLIGTVLSDGYVQITPRGSTMVFDDEHFALWERGKGSTTANLKDGSKVTVFFRKPALREAGILPRAGIARFYGTAKLHKSGPIYEQIWSRLIEPEKKADPEKKGFGVLIKVERAEDLSGSPLTLE